MSGASEATQLADQIAAAAVEFRFLLSRHYRRSHALCCVGDHHQLPARTERRADAALLKAATAAVVCSSDRVVIDGAPRVFDLVRALAGPDHPLGRLCPAPTNSG